MLRGILEWTEYPIPGAEGQLSLIPVTSTPLLSESLQDCHCHSFSGTHKGLQKQVWVCPLGQVACGHDTLTEWVCSELESSQDPQYLSLRERSHSHTARNDVRGAS